MKKGLIILLVIVLSGCTRDVFEPHTNNIVNVPSPLEISESVGIKLESTIVSDEVKMNVKLPNSGTYRVKIRDIEQKLISQEKIIGNEGDNILKVYVSSLSNDGYTLELTDDNHAILGRTMIVVNN